MSVPNSFIVIEPAFNKAFKGIVYYILLQGHAMRSERGTKLVFGTAESALMYARGFQCSL